MSDKDSLEKVFRDVARLSFTLIWKGTSNSWELASKAKISQSLKSIRSASIHELNNLNRDRSYQSLTFSNHSIHLNYFVVNLNDLDDYVCVGIVRDYDTGKRPATLNCLVYLRSDLSVIKKCVLAILGEVASRVSDLDIPLTRREQDILELLSEGKSQKEIAAALGIANSTVESHKARLFSKFQVRSSAELINKAYLSERN